MNEPTVIHSTFVIERSFPVTPERVFAALADPAQKRRWYTDIRSQTTQFEMDFRVGGKDSLSYLIGAGPMQGRRITNHTTYLDIVPNRRVIFAYSMAMEDHIFSASLASFELLPKSGGTDLVFTEQSAFLEGADGPKIRQEGWSGLLDALGKTLGAGSSASHAEN